MVKTKIITCAGYYGTGSSAVTDLLGEFDNIYYLGDYEFRFIQDPNGLADLEYNIVNNYHRHNSGYALKRFKRNIDIIVRNKFNQTYEKTFNGQFKKLMYEYIEELTAFKFKGYWHQDVIDRGLVFWFVERALDKLLNRVVIPLMRKGRFVEPKSINLLKNEVTYIPYANPQHFYDTTKRYMGKLFDIANIENKEFLMVDQLVPPSNTKKYIQYFDNIKIISIDRDPRDLFCLEKYVWHGGVIPVENIEDFCTWFKITRNHLKNEEDSPEHVLRMKFEDLVYFYEESKERICKFIGLDCEHHTKQFLYFRPNVSVENTRLFNKYPESNAEIRHIEKELHKYCYDFPL